MNRFISASLLATVSFLTGCNNGDDREPDYPIEPYIESANVKFVEAGIIDSLNLSFNFRDGDMDLGLGYEMDLDSPYHAYNFYLEDEDQLVKISSNTESINLHGSIEPINTPLVNVHKGKLATIRTRKKSAFQNLPEYVSSFDCFNYFYGDLLVHEKNKAVFDESYNLVETFLNPQVYHLKDTFYYERNENYFNITVDYLVKQVDGSFVEYDWLELNCANFDGRFPILTGMRKGVSVEVGPFKIDPFSSKDGQLRYSMRSSGFKILFGVKIIKLRVKIKDRALHDSNIIETNEIQL
jgi:hypothetical protein